MQQTPGDLTVLQSILTSLQKAAAYNQDDTERPVAILWPDEKREWERVMRRLAADRPELLTLGAYDVAKRSGPAIWLRCVLAGKVPAVLLPSGVVPILYLPGVGRATLRATEDCPKELKPLAELQYLGVFWSQVNAKDWTVAAFLQTSNGGLNLKLARDAATAGSIHRALERLMDVPVTQLASKSAIGPLDSDFFDKFVTDDPVDDLLTWLSDAKGTRSRWDADRWEALCSRCVADYGFDPVKDGELAGGERLGLHTKPVWKTAWKRFTVSPTRYPGLQDLLRKSKPANTTVLFDAPSDEAWPQDNESEEADLRKQLLALAGQPPQAARKLLKLLDAKHGRRREWIWAKLDRSQVVMALRHLSELAEATAVPLAGATTSDVISAYGSGGWKADAAAIETLAAVTAPGDRDAVCAALAVAYIPWLRDGAELFQQRVMTQPLAGRELDRLGAVPAGACVLFADGLRLDVGEKLRAALEAQQLQVTLATHSSALPPVTPTAKPAISPVAGKITGLTPGEEFNPSVFLDGKDLNTDRFRKLLAAEGYQHLAGSETGDPVGKAWAEYPLIDQTGHIEGAGLARRLREILDGLVARVDALLDAGWQEIRIVTDHGWLLMPGGLPRSELPKYLTATRWSRSAVVKVTSTVEFPCFPWHWSADVRIASPHGIDSFAAGKEYSHGGLSVQECVVPQLTVYRGTGASPAARIESVKWSGLRCRVKVGGSAAGFAVDLRDKAADGSTSIARTKQVAKDGTATLLVEQDQREGTATNLLLMDRDGTVVEKIPVNVGG